MCRHLVLISALGIWCGVTPGVVAQTPARQDSLERRIAGLEAQIDSLRQLMAHLVAERRDTTTASGELAALRARARALAPQARSDSAREEFALRSRSLNQLNPELSATADVRARAFRPGPQRDNVEIREFAIGLQAPLDPYTNTKIFASFGGHVEIEEGYAYWTGLPGGLRLDVGRFRQQAGELNRWHLHAVPGTEFPLVITEYFGHHGLVANGVGLYATLPVTSPGHGVHEVWAQGSLASNETLFGSGGAGLSALAHLNNFWQLSRSTYMQVGATVLYGENPDSNVVTRVFGGDVRFTWRPPERALYRSFTVRGEGFAVRRRVLGLGDTRYGGYAGAELQLSRRLYVGGRFDAVQQLEAATSVWQTAAYLTWWQSEWVFGRAEWQHESVPGLQGTRDHADRLVVQLIWSVGPHKHEAY
jgi:cell division protein FtsB